jgi:hypothetical protein
MRSLRPALSAKSRSISPSRRSLMSFDPGPLLASAALTRSLALSPLPAAPDGQLPTGARPTTEPWDQEGYGDSGGRTNWLFLHTTPGLQAFSVERYLGTLVI